MIFVGAQTKFSGKYVPIFISTQDKEIFNEMMQVLACLPRSHKYLVGYVVLVGKPAFEATSRYSLVMNLLNIKCCQHGNIGNWGSITQYGPRRFAKMCSFCSLWPHARAWNVQQATLSRVKPTVANLHRLKFILRQNLHFVTMPSTLTTLPRNGDSSSRGDMRWNPNLWQ